MRSIFVKRTVVAFVAIIVFVAAAFAAMPGSTVLADETHMWAGAYSTGNPDEATVQASLWGYNDGDLVTIYIDINKSDTSWSKVSGDIISYTGRDNGTVTAVVKYHENGRYVFTCRGTGVGDIDSKKIKWSDKLKTAAPTKAPTATPTPKPTATPTPIPEPTKAPTVAPVLKPTIAPTTKQTSGTTRGTTQTTAKTTSTTTKATTTTTKATDAVTTTTTTAATTTTKKTDATTTTTTKAKETKKTTASSEETTFSEETTEETTTTVAVVAQDETTPEETTESSEDKYNGDNDDNIRALYAKDRKGNSGFSIRNILTVLAIGLVVLLVGRYIYLFKFVNYTAKESAIRLIPGVPEIYKKTGNVLDSEKTAAASAWNANTSRSSYNVASAMKELHKSDDKDPRKPPTPPHTPGGGGTRPPVKRPASQPQGRPVPPKTMGAQQTSRPGSSDSLIPKDRPGNNIHTGPAVAAAAMRPARKTPIVPIEDNKDMDERIAFENAENARRAAKEAARKAEAAKEAAEKAAAEAAAARKAAEEAALAAEEEAQPVWEKPRAQSSYSRPVWEQTTKDSAGHVKAQPGPQKPAWETAKVKKVNTSGEDHSPKRPVWEQEKKDTSYRASIGAFEHRKPDSDEVNALGSALVKDRVAPAASERRPAARANWDNYSRNGASPFKQIDQGSAVPGFAPARGVGSTPAAAGTSGKVRANQNTDEPQSFTSGSSHKAAFFSKAKQSQPEQHEDSESAYGGIRRPGGASRPEEEDSAPALGKALEGKRPSILNSSIPVNPISQTPDDLRGPRESQG